MTLNRMEAILQRYRGHSCEERYLRPNDPKLQVCKTEFSIINYLIRLNYTRYDRVRHTNMLLMYPELQLCKTSFSYLRYPIKNKNHDKLESIDEFMQESLAVEYGKQRARVECLMKDQRHLNGEDLDSLKLQDLQNLEKQLEGGLREIRSRKVDLEKVAFLK